MRLRRDYSARLKSARRTYASASSSWPTATAMDSHGSRNATQPRKPGATFKSSVTLNDAIRLWPTPDAQLFNDGESPESFARRQVKHKARGINGNGMGKTIAQAAATWATPTTRDHKRGDLPNRNGKPSLALQSDQWSTPSVADTEGSRKARGGDRSAELLLNGQVESLSGRLDPTPSTTGDASSPSSLNSRPRCRPRLNPAFVEWLMGWPPRWSIARPGFALSETAWSLWLQRMRCELSRLAQRPTAAPPAQLSFLASIEHSGMRDAT